MIIRHVIASRRAPEEKQKNSTIIQKYHATKYQTEIQPLCLWNGSSQLGHAIQGYIYTAKYLNHTEITFSSTCFQWIVTNAIYTPTQSTKYWFWKWQVTVNCHTHSRRWAVAWQVKMLQLLQTWSSSCRKKLFAVCQTAQDYDSRRYWFCRQEAEEGVYLTLYCKIFLILDSLWHEKCAWTDLYREMHRCVVAAIIILRMQIRCVVLLMQNWVLFDMSMQCNYLYQKKALPTIYTHYFPLYF